MRALRSWLGLLGTLALAGLPAPAGAQAVGSEFQINTYTTSHQRTVPVGGHLVAADASGNFVVVWWSYGQDGSNYGIFGQRYDSAGVPQGAEFRVNSFTTSRQTYASVAAAADGDFVVVWESHAQDGSSYGIFGQRYDSTGGTRGSEFRVNSFTTYAQRYPSVAAAADGDFVVVWSSQTQDGSDGIFGQRYDSAGGTRGSEFRVNSYTTSNQRFPSVASDASGNFIVAWHGVGHDDNYGIFGQRYDSAGGALGSEFRVNSYTSTLQIFPSVASDAAGNFVVVWDSFFQDGSTSGIFGQRYDSAGGALGSEFRVNSYTTSNQRFPSVASDASGNFVVVWHSFNNQDGSGGGVFGQPYDSLGVAQGDEFQVNSFTTSYQRFPSVGATGTNQFVVAWESYGQDGNGYGVFGQRFDFGGDTPTLHSGDLDGRSKNAGANWASRVKVEVHDGTHALVSGALVTFSVTSGVGTKTCTTDASGICSVTALVSDGVPSLTYTVTDISKAGFTYAPGANHDPDGNSDGTTIVVLQ